MSVYDNFDFPIKEQPTLEYAVNELSKSGCFYFKVSIDTGAIGNEIVTSLVHILVYLDI